MLGSLSYPQREQAIIRLREIIIDLTVVWSDGFHFALLALWLQGILQYFRGFDGGPRKVFLQWRHVYVTLPLSFRPWYLHFLQQYFGGDALDDGLKKSLPHHSHFRVFSSRLCSAEHLTEQNLLLFFRYGCT